MQYNCLGSTVLTQANIINQSPQSTFLTTNTLVITLAKTKQLAMTRVVEITASIAGPRSGSFLRADMGVDVYVISYSRLAHLCRHPP
jgi:hypothetical protein